MKVILAEIDGAPVTLELKDGIAFLDGEAMPIKNLREKELVEFRKELDELPKSDDPGYPALVNAVRTAFISRLLGHAVGDECVDALTRALDHAHYEVLQYLNAPPESAG